MLIRIFLFILFMTMTIFSQQPAIDPGVSLELAKWRAARYSDVRYRLRLTLEKRSPVLKGTIEVGVNVRETSDIILDWRKIRASEQFSTISNVWLNGKSADFDEKDEHLVIKGAVVGENVVKLDFTSPILTSGGAITRYVDREDQGEYIYSLFVPPDASTAFPVFDEPDLKARFTLSVKAPQDWKAVSNALPEAVQQLPVTHSEDWKNKLFTTQFGETKPISTYVFAFAAGDFMQMSESSTAGELGISTNIFVRRSQVEKFKPHGAEVFRLNREGVKFLEGYFDYKFPFPKYDLVLIPEFPFGGMEHAGATFLREESIIFPQEPTANNYISRANLIFHEAAHQWFGDTVTMRWFDDLWLKEGFAEFMAYKTLEKVMPEYNAWKVFYERNKQAAYLTDSTKGTTPIYQEIPNLNSAKSAYGNIVYRKAPSFLKQAEFYLGADKFQTAIRAFLKKHEYANAGWEDLIKGFEGVTGRDLKDWANVWVRKPGLPKIEVREMDYEDKTLGKRRGIMFAQAGGVRNYWTMRTRAILGFENGKREQQDVDFAVEIKEKQLPIADSIHLLEPGAKLRFVFPNYQDYGYGIFLMDDKSRKYVLANIQNEKDEFLRTMMWGSLWDSVREAELDPKYYVELVIKNLGTEKDEGTISTLLGRVSTASAYYLSDKQRDQAAPRLEKLLLDRMRTAETLGLKLTFYRSFLNIASTENARKALKEILKERVEKPVVKEGITAASPAHPGPFGLPPLKTKDKFDIVTKLIILGDPEAPALLAELEKVETTDEAKRYAYAARGGIATAENKAKFFADFVNNKEISEAGSRQPLALLTPSGIPT